MLLQDFRTADPDKMLVPQIRDRVKAIKASEEGRKTMSSARQELLEETKEEGIAQGEERGEGKARKEIARELLKRGDAHSDIANVTKLSLEEIGELEKELRGA